VSFFSADSQPHIRPKVLMYYTLCFVYSTTSLVLYAVAQSHPHKYADLYGLFDTLKISLLSEILLWCIPQLAIIATSAALFVLTFVKFVQWEDADWTLVQIFISFSKIGLVSCLVLSFVLYSSILSGVYAAATIFLIFSWSKSAKLPQRGAKERFAHPLLEFFRRRNLIFSGEVSEFWLFLCFGLFLGLHASLIVICRTPSIQLLISPRIQRMFGLYQFSWLNFEEWKRIVASVSILGALFSTSVIVFSSRTVLRRNLSEAHRRSPSWSSHLLHSMLRPDSPEESKSPSPEISIDGDGDNEMDPDFRNKMVIVNGNWLWHLVSFIVFDETLLVLLCLYLYCIAQMGVVALVSMTLLSVVATFEIRSFWKVWKFFFLLFFG
jgi:hypothetical protein